MRTKIGLAFKELSISRSLLVVPLLTLLLLLLVIVSSGEVTAGLGFVQPAWTRELPADLCPGTDHTDCHFGSPVVARIDSDSKKDIVVVTNNGHVLAFSHDGSLLWDTDVAPFFGMAPNTHEIHSSPAIADIDNDGYPEIAVGTGTLNPEICTQGGLIVLNHNGGVEPGWPFLAYDEFVPPAGCRDTIVSSPSIGDLDNDGDLEIVAAGFDKRIYAWHHDGTLVDGFPPDSAHRERFPEWEGFKGYLGDNTWGSPAIADLDGDGYLDIIIGTGEGNYESSWGGDAGGWICPYQLPSNSTAPGYCGGSIYALDRHGSTLPGFPIYLYEAIGSSPAVADIDGDGKNEFFIGASDYYHSISPDRPTYGFRLFGFDGQGNELPGWKGGKVTQGVVIQSPSIGNIAGDEEPEIIVLGADNRLYAWYFDGSPVSGFPMEPFDFFGSKNAPFNWIRGQILGDYDGDGKMEIIFAQGWAINIVDGDGKQLTATNFPNNSLPAINADGMIANTPAVDDIDGDGRLELIASASKIMVWNLDQSTDLTSWPMFRGNPARTGEFPQPHLKVAPSNLVLLHQTGDERAIKTDIKIQNIGSGSFDWTAEAPQELSISQDFGTVSSSKSDKTTVIISTKGREEGEHILGNITINATMEVGAVRNAQESISVRLIVGEFYRIFTPLIGN